MKIQGASILLCIVAATGTEIITFRDSNAKENENNIERNQTMSHPGTVQAKEFQRLRGGRNLNDDGIIYQDIPDMSEEDIKSVMNWITAETTIVKNPFCWKDSYGRGAGTVPGRVADCPATYTNNGLTCGRGSHDIVAPSKVADCPSGYTNMGYTCYRGPHDIYSPSRVADCPHGYTNMGLTCTNWNGAPWNWHTVGWGHFTCPSGYFKSNTTQRCHKNCPSGYTNTGESCHRGAISKGMSSMKCPSGYFQSSATARCHKNCPNEYTNMGETCHKPVSTLGLSSMTCNAGNEHKGGVAGERCYPEGSMCYNNGDYDAGLCYPKCKNGFYGVGPVCWMTCSHSMVDCGASCGKSAVDCAIAISDQVIAPLILAANIASLGLTAPATTGATTTIQVGGKTVAGTSKIGKALVKAVQKLQTIKPSGLTEGATVIQRIRYAKFGTLKATTETLTKLDKVTNTAMDNFRIAFAEDFATQTSKEIAAKIDRNFHPFTASYLKGLYGEIIMGELAEANGWQIASSVLGYASIVDITGVFGVISAYAKPVCNAVDPFPCTAANTKAC